MKVSKKVYLSALITLTLSATAATAASSTFREQLEHSVFGKAGRNHSIDPYLIYAVALVEAAYSHKGDRASVSPYLYAIRSSSGAAYPATREDAQVELKKRLASSKNLKEIDVCLMQVNLGWNGHRVTDYNNLFDLDTCVNTGAQILKENLNSTNSLYEAIGRYNTWQNKEAAKKYAIKVVDVYNRLPR